MELDEENGKLSISLDTANAVVGIFYSFITIKQYYDMADIATLSVEATTLQLKEKLENSLQRVRATVFPIPNP